MYEIQRTTKSPERFHMHKLAIFQGVLGPYVFSRNVYGPLVGNIRMVFLGGSLSHTMFLDGLVTEQRL